jgi:haloacetate dehalogenase
MRQELNPTALDMTPFPGFETRRLRVNGVMIHGVVGGQGTALLLLHGYPQSHVMWQRIAPKLAAHYTVVCPDLRGYGDSSKPRGLPDHANYSKRVMAQDMVEYMQRLGHARFHLVGHDRGARVSHRLARDHGPQVVRTFTAIDIAPTLAMYEATDMAFARAYYHWFLMLQPAPLAEKMVAAVAPYHILAGSGLSAKGLKAFSKEALAEYVRAFSDPRTIHATCEDYRASGGIDLDHDRADRGKKLSMPMQVLWGKRGVVGTQFDPLGEWRKVARNVTGHAIDCGHFIPEEAPAPTLAAIRSFLARHERA